MSSDLFAGRYRLIASRSRTRMAEVLEAEDLVLGRRVALKLLGGDADAVRFEREARAAAALTHPNIVQVFDYGRHDRRPYMVLEYLEGGTLEGRLAGRSRLDDDEVLRIAHDIAAGLAYAHEHGVIHRDLKPGNVLFDGEGRAKVGDFGIARVVGADTLTAAGTVVGTAAYISPEQVAGTAITPATDVYSFGVLLYRMLSGRLPFESENTLELAEMHRTREPLSLRSIRPDAPPLLAAMVTRALAKEPQARPRDGTELSAMLGGEPATVAVREPPTVVLPTPRRRAPRPRVAIALAALVLVAAGVAAAVLVTGRHASAPVVTSGPRHATTAERTRSASSTTRPAESATSTASTTTPSTESRTNATTSRTPPPSPSTSSSATVPSVSGPTTSTSVTSSTTSTAATTTATTTP